MGLPVNPNNYRKLERIAAMKVPKMRRDMREDNDIDKVLEKFGIEQPRCGAHCGNGWVPHIEKLFHILVGMGWNKDLQQIKEKFGQLRVYVGPGATEAMHDVINDFEAQTATMCEMCGEEGKIDAWSGYWYKCLCPVHGPTLNAKD